MDDQRGEKQKRAGSGARALTAARAALGIDTWSFRGKAVLITGGSRGLGLVLARRLARAHAKIAIVARDEEELARAKEDLQKLGATAVTLQLDVTKKAEAEEAVARAAAELGPIDVLINNAGVIQTGPMELMTDADYEEAMNTHFWAPLHMTNAVLPSMKERGRGRIVNISSIGGKVPVPHLLPYAASKFALTGLSEGMRAELLKDGIVVTTVCPGLMRTGSPLNAFFKGKHRAEYAWFSLMDSLPISSVSAESAARQILRACRRGKAELIISPQAKLAARMHGLFPGLTTDLMGLVNRFLPGPGGIGKERALGRDSQSWLSSSFLTVLTYRAAKKNNELL
jgi:short-subunit dehydrogenase